MIIPTVGRVVWFHPAANTRHADFSPPAAGEPVAAIIAAVLQGQPVDIVNLAVFDAMGTSHARTMVPLIQEGQDVPEGGYYATWMPYQIGQAKKAETIRDAQPDQQQIRYQCLQMALQTPGAGDFHEVLAAAKAYQQHIEAT